MKQFNVRVGLGIILGGLLSGGLLATSATAASLQFSFTGTVLGSNLGLSPPFAIGQTMSGSFTVSPLTDSNVSPNIARYDNQITGLSVTIGTGTPYVATFAPTDNRLTIRNLPGFDDARLVANTPTSFAPVNGFTPTRFNITLADGTATAFNSQYPTSVPSISAFTTTNQWRLVFTGGRVVQGALSNITAVPLPAAVILFGAGLVALVGLGAGSWRKRRSDAAEMSS